MLRNSAWVGMTNHILNPLLIKLSHDRNLGFGITCHSAWVASHQSQTLNPSELNITTTFSQNSPSTFLHLCRPFSRLLVCALRSRSGFTGGASVLVVASSNGLDCCIVLCCDCDSGVCVIDLCELAMALLVVDAWQWMAGSMDGWIVVLLENCPCILTLGHRQRRSACVGIFTHNTPMWFGQHRCRCSLEQVLRSEANSHTPLMARMTTLVAKNMHMCTHEDVELFGQCIVVSNVRTSVRAICAVLLFCLLLKLLTKGIARMDEYLWFKIMYRA